MLSILDRLGAFQMRICAAACAAVVVASSVSAQAAPTGIELLSGHPVYHEGEQEAGVAMALSIRPEHDPAADLAGLCQELRRAAALEPAVEDQLRLETIFVVPRKGMAIEGYYWSGNGGDGDNALVPGRSIARGTLDDIVARAGIPPRVLDETDVEHEVSCDIVEPSWHIVWHDVRAIGDEVAATVIERARDRFLAIYHAVLEHKISSQKDEASGLARANVASGLIWGSK